MMQPWPLRAGMMILCLTQRHGPRCSRPHEDGLRPILPALLSLESASAARCPRACRGPARHGLRRQRTIGQRVHARSLHVEARSRSIFYGQSGAGRMGSWLRESMTCMAMCGSGARIGWAATRAALWLTPQVQAPARTACCVAARGTAPASIAAQPIGASTARSPATSASASAWSGHRAPEANRSKSQFPFPTVEL